MLGGSQAWNATGGTNDALTLSGNDSMKMKLIANGISDILATVIGAVERFSAWRGCLGGSAALLGSNRKTLIEALRLVGIAASLTQMTAEIGTGVYGRKNR